MATKTLILRPTGYKVQAGSAPVPYPADTSADNCHLLVSEECADNDSTYIQYTDAMLVSHGLLFTPPIEKITPLQIRVIGVVRSQSSKEVLAQWLSSGMKEDGSITAGIDINDEPLVVNSEFTTLSASYSTEAMLQFWNLFQSEQNDQAAYHLSMRVEGYADGSSSKNDDLTADLTQVYLEIDYDDNETELNPVVYINKNGAWTPVYGTIYKKIDNTTWQLSTLDHLTAEMKIIVKEV